MNRERSLSSLLRERAGNKRSKVGIGVTAPTESLVAGFNRAARFCEPMLYGSEVEGFASVVSPKPEEALFNDLESGKLDAVVRGQIHSPAFRNRFLKHYDPSFNPAREMIPVLEFPGNRPMLLSPASIFAAGTPGYKEKIIEASVRLCRLLDLPVRIALLTRCRAYRLDNLAGTPIGQDYRDIERLVERYRDRFDIRNYEIDFEMAYRDGATILIEPDGTVGNQVIRTLYYLGVVRFYGAPYVNAEHVVLESFKNGRDYPDVMLLAAALAGCRRSEDEDGAR